MSKTHLLFTFLFTLMTNSILQAASHPQISFKVSFKEPQAHYAEVQMNLADVKGKEVEVAMPVWAPGSYLVREFAKNVEGFGAYSAGGSSLNFEKTDKNTWKIKTAGNKNIVLKYRVYAFEVSVRTSFIDANHAFLSPTGIFMYVKGALDAPVTVEVAPHHTWSKISTGLEAVAGQKNTFKAQNFDWLFDSPIEVGNQDIFEFEAAGVHHEFAMVGGGNYDKERLIKDVSKIIEEETAMFGVNPNKRYVFIVHNYLKGGGGLEHLNSTVLGATRDNYTNPAKYNDFLSLVAHEYFHLWNVKRLRPIALGPFDYDKENYTRELWIAEGFTAYYDNMLTLRIGAYSKSSYLKILQADMALVKNSEGAKVQSVSDASFDAWIKQYRPNENSINTSISYYNKGAVLAAMLDLAILHETKGQKGLDNVMRQAYEEFYVKKQRGYTSEEFKSLLEKVSGRNLDQFYDDYVNGTKDLDLNAYLSFVGYELRTKENTPEPFTGLTIDQNGLVTKVIRNSPAWTEGINVNDEILAVNGERVRDINEAVKKMNIGDEAVVLLNRDGLVKEVKMRVFADPREEWELSKLKNATEEQQAQFKRWLRQ
mgnify:CR=1 FL=1